MGENCPIRKNPHLRQLEHKRKAQDKKTCAKPEPKKKGV